MEFRKNTEGFRKLIVWQKAQQLSLLVYQFTTAFPQSEQFGVTKQIRTAAASIAANIAEGSSQRTYKHQNHFYTIAKGSLHEVDNFAELTHNLHYLSNEQYKKLLEYINKTAFLLSKLINRSKSPTHQTQKTPQT